MKRREEGSIEERVQGKKYLIRWTCNGCEKYKHTQPKRHNRIINGDYIEAQKQLTDAVRPVNNAQPKPSERTFASYCDTEWAQYTADHWKGTTRLTQGSFVTRHIRPFFDSMVLSKITPSDVVRFHQKLEADGLSKKTRRNIHTVLTTMFNYAADTLELISKSPVKKGLAPKLDKREKPSLTVEQAWNLWDQLKDNRTIRNRAFYGTLLFTGVRTSEALGLKWSDVDFGNRQITIRRAINRGKEDTPKTKASLRTRPISPELYSALLNHKAMATYNQPNDYLFTSSSGRPANPDQLRETLQTVLRDRMGIHLGKREDGLHLLRHTSGSLVFRATGSVKEAQRWLGHSSSRITMDTYVHLMGESQQQTAEVAFSRPAIPVEAPKQAN